MDQLIEFVGNHAILAGIWVALVILIVYGFVTSKFSPIKELSTQEATFLMNKEEALVLDIRAVNDFKKGHILGAKQLKTEALNQGDFSTLEKHKDKPIIVVCAMGATAKGTASKMSKAGFLKVFVLKGGMSTWQSANLPVNK